jgi:hypothetical protein
VVTLGSLAVMVVLGLVSGRSESAPSGGASRASPSPRSASPPTRRRRPRRRDAASSSSVAPLDNDLVEIAAKARQATFGLLSARHKLTDVIPTVHDIALLSLPAVTTIRFS